MSWITPDLITQIVDTVAVPIALLLLYQGIAWLKKHGYKTTYADAVVKAVGAGQQAAAAAGTTIFTPEGRALALEVGTKYLISTVSPEAAKIGIDDAGHAARVDSAIGVIAAQAAATVAAAGGPLIQGVAAVSLLDASAVAQAPADSNDRGRPIAAVLAVVLLMAIAVPAWAYVEFVDPTGNKVPGAVTMGVNGAGQAVPGKTGTFTPLGCPPWQAVTTTAPVALSAFAGGIPTGATLAEITTSVAIVKRDDGGPPGTAGPGSMIAAGMVYPASVTPLSQLQFIAQTANGVIAVCFFR
jgi:hypothetical protein